MRSRSTVGVIAAVIGISLFVCGVPIYALALGAYGGVWVDAVQRMAITLAVPSVVLFFAGMQLLIRKWWATFLASFGALFFEFAWFATMTFWIGLLTGKGW